MGPPYVREMSEPTGDRARLVELMEDMHVAMLTTLGPDGPRTVPMARQEVEPDADLWFITSRDTEKVREIEAQPRVALSFSSSRAWVAMTGTARVVEDRERLAEYWSTFAEAWLPGGPDNPEATLIHVAVDEAEYWDTPGGKVASLISFAKTKLTGETYDADHGTVRP